MDNRLKKTMVISVVAIVAIFLVVMIFGLIKNRNLSYSKVEEKMKNAAIEYYSAHPTELPQEEENDLKIDVKTLVEKEYIKALDEYLEDGKKCSGEVYVTLRNGEYSYTPYLTCEDYTTETLAKHIKEAEELIEDKNAGEHGLYNYDGTLIYRGENVNNYVSFANQLWRVLRIDANGNIRMIQEKDVERITWDNRYNIETEDSTGYNDFEKSRLKDEFARIMNGDYGDIFTEYDKQKMVNDYLCLDAKNESSFNLNGVIECNQKSEDRYQFTLLDINEYYLASADANCNSMNNYSCNNYNYLSTYGSYWSMNRYSGNSYQAYYISGGANLSDVESERKVKMVVTLSKHVPYASGDGSYNNPYVVE